MLPISHLEHMPRTWRGGWLKRTVRIWNAAEHLVGRCAPLYFLGSLTKKGGTKHLGLTTAGHTGIPFFPFSIVHPWLFWSKTCTWFLEIKGLPAPVFETRCYPIQAGLELSVKPKVTLDFWPWGTGCACFPRSSYHRHIPPVHSVMNQTQSFLSTE